MNWNDILKNEEKRPESDEKYSISIDKEEFINLIKNTNDYLDIYYMYVGKKIDKAINHAINWLAAGVSESELSDFYDNLNNSGWSIKKND